MTVPAVILPDGEKPARTWEDAYDRMTCRLVDAALALIDDEDAIAAGAKLADFADQTDDRLGALHAARWSLLGRLDHDPRDLTALAALGLTVVAACTPTPEDENRREQARSFGANLAVTTKRNGSSTG